jgi:hypothetical protein
MVIILIFASWVARITGESYQHLNNLHSLDNWWCWNGGPKIRNNEILYISPLLMARLGWMTTHTYNTEKEI